MSDALGPTQSAHSRESGNPGAECLAPPKTQSPPSRGRAEKGSSRRLLAIAVGLAACCVGGLGAAAWKIAGLGPAPLGKDIAFSTRVVDREGRLLRAYATPEGRWRLPARVADVDPRFFAMLFAYEDKRFLDHHVFTGLEGAPREVVVRRDRRRDKSPSRALS